MTQEQREEYVKGQQYLQRPLIESFDEMIQTDKDMVIVQDVVCPPDRHPSELSNLEFDKAYRGTAILIADQQLAQRLIRLLEVAKAVTAIGIALPASDITPE